MIHGDLDPKPPPKLLEYGLPTELSERESSRTVSRSQPSRDPRGSPLGGCVCTDTCGIRRSTHKLLSVALCPSLRSSTPSRQDATNKSHDMCPAFLA